MIDVEDRFWSKVRIGDGCWEWITPTANDRGRGRFYMGPGRGQARAHRASWELANGRPVPPGMVVCHHCDNPRCVRPWHLFIGTQADNLADMLAKGRHGRTSARGSANPKAILSAADVLTIRRRRASGETCVSIARDLGVSRATVSHIVTGRNWAHVAAEVVQ